MEELDKNRSGLSPEEMEQMSAAALGEEPEVVDESQ